MFCPRCGAGLSGRPEYCSACRADLRPLAATGFFEPLPSLATGERTRDDGSAETGVSITPAALGVSPTGGDADMTVLGGPALPLEAVDPDATRLGAPAISQAISSLKDRASRGTPLPARPPSGARSRLSKPPSGAGRMTPPPPRPPSGAGTNRPQTGVALPATEGPLQTGENFGSRYHIIRLLGIGGMGAVYHAWDSELEVALAFKVIRPDATADPAVAAEIEGRFKRELLLARQVTHPNVVRIHDLGEIDGIKYITMPYIEGRDLSDILAESGTLPVPRVLGLAKQIVSGLAAAHEAGVVHRDLKPANIMIDADDRALIMDFGIARAQGGPADVAVAGGISSAAAGATRIGTIVGTIEYMAPEQARAEAVDHRADIYAVGMMLYRMLVGVRSAERATDPITNLTARMKAEPPRLRTIDATLPEAVELIVSKCLQPDPAARYQDARELLDALEQLDDNGNPLPIIRRVKLRTMVASVVLLLTALAGMFYYAQRIVVPVEHGPVSLLVTNFTNSTQDPVFEGSLEHALTVDVEGASFITTFDRYEASRIAQRMKAGTVLDQETGRAVARREGINLILAGSIAPKDSGYVVSVRGIDPADGKQLWTESADAKTKADVLSAVGRVAAEVRRELGDEAPRAKRLEAGNIMASRALPALREYAVAQELFLAGKVEEAVPYYERSVAADPNFGRAYANWGLAASRLGRTEKAEELWKKALSLADRMTEHEKFNTLGAYYATIARNYEKAIESYEAVTKLSPADARAHNNLSIAYFRTRNFPKAMEEIGKAVKIYPRNVNRRINYALYAMYAGDFDAAAKQAEENAKEPSVNFLNYMPLAMAAISRNDFAAAEGAYERMAAAGAQGASLAATGRADLALYRGRYDEAQTILRTAIDADRAAKQTAGLSAKLIELAETYEASGQAGLAEKTVREALQLGHEEGVLLPSALLLLRAGLASEAEDIAAELENMLQTQTRAYAKVIDGEAAARKRRRATAIDAFRESIKLGDPWLARFKMGVAYVEADHHAEAIAELEACLKRRGEVTAMFLDESPTMRYTALLPYWLGRAQAGLGQNARAKASFESFLKVREGSPDDPIVADARQRLSKLPG